MLRLTGAEVERVPTVRLGVERGGAVMSRGRGEATLMSSIGGAGVVKSSNGQRPWRQRDLLLLSFFFSFPSSSPLLALPLLLFFLAAAAGKGKIPPRLGFAAADWGLL